MKFQIKLNQEETDAFQNVVMRAKPDDLSLEDFVRSLFFTGIHALEEHLTNQMVEHMKANREQFEASGFSFDDDGNLTGVPNDMLEEEQGTVDVLE